MSDTYFFNDSEELFGDKNYTRHFFPKITPIKYSVQQQQIVINGVPHVQEIKTPYLVCPSCDQIIAQLPQDISEEALAELCTEQLSAVKYCAHCGQRLKYPKVLVCQV